MNLRKYKVLIVVIIATVALFLASPTLSQLLANTQTDHFTEFSLLGSSNDTKSYPDIIISGQSFSLYLNVQNHLGSVGNYLIRVKFRDQSGSAPNSFTKTSSTLPSLYDMRATVNNQENLEIPLTISLVYIGTTDSKTLINIVINGYSVGGSTVVRNSTGGFFGNLFFELWLFNDATNTYEYNQRYVGLWLNLT